MKSVDNPGEHLTDLYVANDSTDLADAEAADTGAPPNELPATGATADGQPELGPSQDAAELTDTDGSWDAPVPSVAPPAEGTPVEAKPQDTQPAPATTSQLIGGAMLHNATEVPTAETFGDTGSDPSEPPTDKPPTSPTDAPEESPADTAADSGSGNGPIDHGPETSEDDNGPHDAIPGRQKIIDTLESIKTEDDPDGSRFLMRDIGGAVATDKEIREDQGNAIIYSGVAVWRDRSKVGEYDKHVGAGVVAEAVTASVQENGFFEDEVQEPPKPVTADQVVQHINDICDRNNTHLASRDPERVRSADDPEAVQDLEDLRQKTVAHEKQLRDFIALTRGEKAVPKSIYEMRDAMVAARTKADLANMDPTEDTDEGLRRLIYVERGLATAADACGGDEDDPRVRSWHTREEEAWSKLGADWESEAFFERDMPHPSPGTLVWEYKEVLVARLAQGGLDVQHSLDLIEDSIALQAVGRALHAKGHRYDGQLIGNKPVPTLEEIKHAAREVMESMSIVEISVEGGRITPTSELARRVENWGIRQI